MAVPADPAQVQAQFQAMTNYFANSQQSVMTPLLQSAETKLAQYGPGAHEFEGMTINFEAVAQGLRADIAQAGQWLSNARALLSSGSAEAIQAMRQMLASGSIQVIVEEGAASLEPAAPAIITGGLAGAGIAQASGMSMMAAVGLGLAGGLVLAGLIGGGYWAYNHYRQTNSAQPIAAVTTTQAAPPPAAVPTDTGGPTETAPPGQPIPPPLQPPPPVDTGQPTAQPPPPPVAEPPAVPTTTTTTTTTSAAAADINGTYSLTPDCPVSRCWLKVTRQGSDTAQLTLAEHTLPQYPNEGFTISQMRVTVDSSGAFQGSGTATEEDVGGQGHVTHQAVSYTITGTFHDASGRPLTTSGATGYALTLGGDSTASTSGAASFSGQR